MRISLVFTPQTHISRLLHRPLSPFLSPVNPLTPALIPALTALLLLALPAKAQIYADFTVSVGTPPSNTPLGTFRAILYHEKAPRPVAAFIGLATGNRPWINPVTHKIDHTPFYDGQIFHRHIHNFVIQGGDYLAGGQGGPGFVQREQFHPDLRHDSRYILSMAKGNLPNSGGSQFFITLDPTPHLDDKHSVFGKVITNTAIIDNFNNATLFPTTGDPDNIPVNQINLDSVVISGPDLATFDLFDPSLELPTIRQQTIKPLYLPDEDVFRLTWDRSPQTHYFLYAGQTLNPVPSLAVLYNSLAEADKIINITGVDFPNYFAQVLAIDYGYSPNPPADLVAAGPNITLNDRAGNSLSLDFTSASAGTWTHSDTSSGTFTVTGAFDGSGPNEDRIYTNLTAGTSFVALIPLFQINLNFNSPVGPKAWLNFEMILNFFDDSSGWAEIKAGIAAFPFVDNVFQAFTYTP